MGSKLNYEQIHVKIFRHVHELEGVDSFGSGGGRALLFLVAGAGMGSSAVSSFRALPALNDVCHARHTQGA